MKTNEKAARVRADEKKASTNDLRVRSGVRAGLRGSWSLGNKVWTDDWLAPV